MKLEILGKNRPGPGLSLPLVANDVSKCCML